MTTKRAQIVAIAADVIHKKGYQNTKVEDVLLAAEIGKGQFYHYF
ncbi:TetR/AcrR family transcriptional regulator, partial [Calditerricola satsumensis]